MTNTKKIFKKITINSPQYFILLLFTVFTLYMFGWIVLASLSNTPNIFSGNILKGGLTLNNYRKIFQGATTNAGLTLLNTLIYTIPSSIILIFIAAPAAYVLSRFEFKGNRLTQQLFVMSLSVPGIMVTMPIFYHLSSMGIVNSRFIIILLFVAESVPYDVYYLAAYFKNLSTSYEESAAIDGASHFRIFWDIMFPMARPAIITLTIFNLIGKWNAYFLPLIFANTPSMRPVGVWLEQMVAAMIATGNYGGMFAAVVIAAAPTIILYAFLSNKMIKGVDQGGIKG